MPVTMILGTGAYSSKTLVSVALLRLLSQHSVKAAPYKALVVLRRRDERSSAQTSSGMPHHVLAARIQAAPWQCPATVWQTGPYSGRLELTGGISMTVPIPCRDTVDLAALPQPERTEIIRLADAAAEEALASCDHLVVEGAGSPIVLDPELDLPNVLVARRLRPSIVLVGQYSHGAAAASVIGTYQCLPADVRALVRGFVLANTPPSRLVDRSMQLVEDACGLPALGTLPANDDLAYDDLYTDPAIDGWAAALAQHVAVDTLLAE